MKISKLLLIGALAAGMAGTAFASATDIYIAGSTAFRASATAGIIAMLQPGYTWAWDGGSAGKSVYGGPAAIFSGVMASGSAAGTSVIIHTYWTGSASGVIDLAYPNQITKFMGDSVTMTTSGTNLYNTGYATATAYVTAAFSDAYYDSVAKSVATAPTYGKTFSTAIDNGSLKQAGTLAIDKAPNGVLGIIPFVWVAGAQTTGSAPFTNITQQVGSALEKGGYVSVSQVGISNTTDYIFCVGRNEDSGTRIIPQAEIQIGSTLGLPSFGQPINQYYGIYGGTVDTDGSFPADDYYGGTNGPMTTTMGLIQCGGTAATVTDIGLWPADAPVNTETTLNWQTEGHSGQISGGDVATMLSALNPLYLNLQAVDGGDGAPSNWDPTNSTDHVNKAYIVSAIGVSDAGSIPSSENPVYLSYNGVPYSPANILNGSYTLWGFEHLYYRTAGANEVSLTQQECIDTLADLITTTYAQTDSSGNTDSATPPTDAKVGGIFFNSAAKFTRTREGYPLIPSTNF